MIPSNPVPQVCNYGTSATYRDLPNEEQLRNGVVPLDSLPAAWWNCMWNMTNGAINCARYAAGVLIDEVNTVLAQAGVCVNCGCVDQLYQAINKIRQTIGTAAVAGAVKSSSTASEVAIDPTTGIMSVNCLGNAASLTTTASTVVGAINELKSTYDTCWSNNTTALSGKAPTSHASTTTSYGVGTASNYGHLKISDVYNDSNCQGTDIAASQKAVYCAWKVASDAAAGNISLGNTNGCALGTASAGTATTAARSDHVHPTQGYLPYTGTGNGAVTANQQSTSYCGSAAEWASYLIFNHGDGSNYYNQMIRMPFGGVPQYQRKSNGTNSGWKTFITTENIASQSVNYATSAGSATNATNACTAACNSSGTAFGTAAVYNIRSGGSVTYIPYSGTAANCVLTGNFLAYWNGAYSNAGASNLRYYCGGAFGTAAACAATAFRASDWWPDNVTCGCVCYADSAWSASTALRANCASCAHCYSLKGKWCCVCSTGPGTVYMRIYVCFAATGNYMIFPGGCFIYMPTGIDSSTRVSAPAMLASITTVNAWTAVGPTYVTYSCCCVSPACTTTGNIPAIQVY